MKRVFVSRDRRRRPVSETGLAMMWMAILTPILLAIVGLAVDASYYTYRGIQAQRSADAAALAGVVFLPDDPTGAFGEAGRLLDRNGFTGTRLIALGARQNQLKVMVTEQIPSFFARIVGKDSFVLQKRAVSEYAQPLGLGSPQATLGNDPESGGTQPNFWLSQFGPAARKHDGDRFGGDNCVDDSTDVNTPVYRCNNTSNTRGANSEFRPDGYKYAINTRSAPAGQDLEIAIFDPVMANVGARCDLPVFPVGGQLSAIGTWIGDASTRYLSGATAAGLAWCTGDHQGNYWPNSYSGPMPATIRFDVFAPSGSVLTGVAPLNPIPSPPPPVVIPGPTGAVSPPCSAVSGPVHTLGITNNRTTDIRVNAVSGACMQSVQVDIPAGTNSVVTTFDATRWRVFNISDDSLVEDFVLAAAGGTTTKVYNPPLVGGPVVPGPCSDPPTTNRVLTIDNQRTDDVVLQYIDDACVLTTVATISAGSAFADNRFDGQRFQVRTTSSQLIDDFVLDDPGRQRRYDEPTGGTGLAEDPVCRRDFHTFRLQSFNSSIPYSGTMFELLYPADGVRDNGSGTRDAAAEEFARGFRRWVTICRIPAASVSRGTYTVRVRNDIEEPNGGTSKNGYSIRSAWVDPGTGARSETGLSTTALERLPVYVNFGGVSSSDLYMTRVTPEYAGKFLRVELFDIGDTAAGTVNLTFVPPTDGTGTPWTCEISKVTASAVTPAGSGCTISGLTRNQFNGAVVRIRVAVPEDYSCDESLKTNCWSKISMSFNGGALPTDQTTWTAVIEGDPLRLVK